MNRFCKHCEYEHPFTKEYWYSITTAPQCKAYQKAWRQGKPEEKKRQDVEQTKKWRENNRERARELGRNYYYRNREKVIKANYMYRVRRIETDPIYKVPMILRSRLNSALKSNSKSLKTLEYLGCSIDEFKKYFESKFSKGMSWDNHGEWHIDHIIPLSSFNLACEDEIRRACNYLNLQPLWAADNYKKSNKLLNKEKYIEFFKHK